MIKYFYVFLLLVDCKEVYSTITYQDATVYGPGLRPDNIVMPARYIFVNFSSIKEIIETQNYIQDVKFEISSKSNRNYQCRLWANKLDRKDGIIIIRYKVYEMCKNAQINILYKGHHIGKSPYKVPGTIIPDQCNCPQKNINKWLKSNDCTGDYSKINEDLKLFSNVNMQVELSKIIDRLYRPDSNSFCHYIVKSNKIYRECYGKHVGFNMFTDSILLSLTRKVVLPDVEFVMNLGDWPLSSRSLEKLPIFSWCGNNKYFDIVLPTYDITESSLENMGRITLDMLSVQGNVNLNWSEREPRAFWRGRDSNKHRLNLIDIARKHPHLINASMTNFFFYTDKKEEYGPKQPHISFFRFFDYKYQINIDGTVAAYRFPYLLAGGGLILKQKSPYEEHFYKNLQEWTHYVPIENDLSDLVEKLNWARENDDAAYNIAKNGQKFANERLLPQHIFCYHVVLFNEWSKRLSGKVVVSNNMTKVDGDECEFPCPNAEEREEL